MDLKKIYQKYGRFLRPALYMRNRVLGLRITQKGSGNRIAGIDRCRMKGVRIYISGSSNEIEIGEMSTLTDVSISIHGSGNRIILGRRNFLTGCSFCIEDDGNRIETGEHTYIYNNTELSAIEGTTLTVGADCLFSADITIRTGDSHSILNREGKRINPSADVSIGNHVWIGKGASVLKSSRIAENCVVGTGAVITGSAPVQAGTILAGSPARIVKTDITWSQQRV